MSPRIVKCETFDDVEPFDMIDEGRTVHTMHWPSCQIDTAVLSGDCFPIDGRCVVSPVWDDPEIVTLTYPTNVVRGMCPPVPNCWGVSGCFLKQAKSAPGCGGV